MSKYLLKNYSKITAHIVVGHDPDTIQSFKVDVIIMVSPNELTAERIQLCIESTYPDLEPFILSGYTVQSLQLRCRPLRDSELKSFVYREEND